TAQDATKQQDGLTKSSVCEFVKQCGFYFIATAEGDQPRVRPFGTMTLYENRLYIQTSKQKYVAKQLKANPKIEICAYNQSSGEWMRIAATTVADERIAAKKYILDQYPELKSMYSPDDDKTLILYLKDVTVMLNSFAGETKTVKF
ncbi:MAG: pyridoxamine 5'-phosphate oxidase family protein, partial [Tannerellaceae bacterium]|nr:pyridoxamine 5'-phosphate oxidase family protein [Tannerellaceae bacterium]